MRFPRDLGINIISHLFSCFCQLSKALRQVSLATSNSGDCAYESEGELVRENKPLQLEVSLRVRGERWVFCSLFIYFLLCFLDATKYLLK